MEIKSFWDNDLEEQERLLSSADPDVGHETITSCDGVWE